MKQKSNIYYDGFVDCMDYACKAAEYLRAMIIGFTPDTLEVKAAEVHEIEHAADLAKHAVIQKLAKEFITPIEREDIMALFQQIDDVTDNIEDVVRRMYMFNITKIRPDMHEFASLISQCCTITKQALSEMYDFQKSTTLRSSIILINELEESGDRLHYAAMRRLYTEENVTPLERLQWTKMYDWLEDCCDKCEDVSDSIEMILLKNS